MPLSESREHKTDHIVGEGISTTSPKNSVLSVSNDLREEDVSATSSTNVNSKPFMTVDDDILWEGTSTTSLSNNKLLSHELGKEGVTATSSHSYQSQALEEDINPTSPKEKRIIRICNDLATGKISTTDKGNLTVTSQSTTPTPKDSEFRHENTDGYNESEILNYNQTSLNSEIYLKPNER